MSEMDDLTPEVPTPPKPSRSRAKSEDTVVVDSAALAKAVSQAPLDATVDSDIPATKPPRSRKAAAAAPVPDAAPLATAPVADEEEPFVIGDVGEPEADLATPPPLPWAQASEAPQTWDWDADEDFSYSPGVMVTPVAAATEQAVAWTPEAESQPALAETTEYPAVGEEYPEEVDSFAAEQAARDRALGKVAPVLESDLLPPLPPPAVPAEPWTASLGLLLLRVVVAVVVGIYGVQHLTGMAAFADSWTQTVLPAGGTIAAVLAVAEVALSVLLLFGMIVRVAGALIFLMSSATLAFVLWGAENPFQAGVVGFVGDLELLLATVGLLLLLLGGGGWGVDGALRRSNAERRAHRS